MEIYGYILLVLVALLMIGLVIDFKDFKKA